MHAPPTCCFTWRALVQVMFRRAAAVLLFTPLVAQAATIEVSPGEDWCSVVNGAAPGDEIVLKPGDHSGPCNITSASVTVRGEPASVVYSGSSSNVVDVSASDVTLLDLDFGPTNANIDAIKIKSGDRTHVEGCIFEHIGGISISANTSDSDGIVIRGKTFIDLQATGIYLGCHSGSGSCVATDFLIEDNLIDGVTSSGVGYGIEVKVDSWGTLADNVIHDAQGPAIHIFGSYSDSSVSVVERNYLVDSRVNNTLEIGGGPVVVRNNIVSGDLSYALYVYDYGDRGITRDVQIVGNIFDGDIGLASGVWQAGLGHELQNNATTLSAISVTSGIPMDGNVFCDSSCWTGDFWPIEGGALTTGGVSTDLDDDFCGTSRTDPPHVGALQHSSTSRPSLAIDFKSAFGCESDTGTGTDTDSDTDADPGEAGGKSGGGCGCSAGTAPLSSVLALLCLVGPTRRASSSSTGLRHRRSLS